MATIEYVKKIDNFIPLRTVLVSCMNKDGLVSNKRSDGPLMDGIPEEGLLGLIAKLNSKVQFLSTGGTYKLLIKAGLNVKEIAEHTRYPEMKTGLVKSLHPAVHAGILAHKHTELDDAFMKEQNLVYIDAVIVNFYPLDQTKADPDSTFEMLRQMIDIGGPTMAHNARKAFVSTALITDPGNYHYLIEELKNNNGAISLATRLDLAKKASKLITNYMITVDDVIQSIDITDIESGYKIIDSEEENEQ